MLSTVTNQTATLSALQALVFTSTRVRIVRERPFHQPFDQVGVIESVNDQGPTGFEIAFRVDGSPASTTLGLATTWHWTITVVDEPHA